MQTTIKKKLQLIYLPSLAVVILFIVLYSFLKWLLFIKINAFSIKEEIVNFWLPFGLSWILVLIWIRPRIKLLYLRKVNNSWPDRRYFLYESVAVLIMSISTLFTQKYIDKASGTLTKLETINEIDKVEQTKYYMIKNFYIDKKNIGVHSFFDITGGLYNKYYNMYIYVVLPILGSEADTTNSSCSTWLGIKYHKQISNRLDDKEKEEKYQEFVKASEKDFENKDVNQFVYLERVGNTDDGDEFKEAVRECPKYNSNNPSIFLAVNEPFENRTEETFTWMLESFLITSGIWLIMVLVPDFDENELRRFESEKPSSID